MPVKQNLKEHFEDGRLDLSMLGMAEIPVKDIAAIPKAHNLDLSNNCLTNIGKNFPQMLTHLVHLDLSRNKLVELPENIGLLVNLRHLDLYSNQLKSLPLSFGNLKALRWLDLKQNPLMPKLAEIAGPCLDTTQCANAAKSVVELLAMMNKQVDDEKHRRQEQRQKQLEENERKAYELKKQQQALKKKMKKIKKNEAELASKESNGGLNNDSSNQLNNETENGNLDDHSGEINDSSHKLREIKATPVYSSLLSKVFQFCATLSKILIICTLIIVFSLFILNLLDETYYNAARKHLIYVRNQVSQRLPKPVVTNFNKAYRIWDKMFMKGVKKLNKYSMIGIKNIQEWYFYLSTHETIQLYLEQIKSGWHVLWIRISEIYRTLTEREL